MVQQLKDKIDKSKEEIEEIQGEVKFFKETVLVNRVQESAAVAHNEPLSIGSERSAGGSTSDEVNYGAFISPCKLVIVSVYYTVS